MEELYAIAIANLGPMDKRAFSDFEEKIQDIAREQDIENPMMVLDIKYKKKMATQLGMTEQPRLITSSEWAHMREDVKSMAEYMPSVFVVDGNKYTA